MQAERAEVWRRAHPPSRQHPDGEERRRGSDSGEDPDAQLHRSTQAVAVMHIAHHDRAVVQRDGAADDEDREQGGAMAPRAEYGASERDHAHDRSDLLTR